MDTAEVLMSATTQIAVAGIFSASMLNHLHINRDARREIEIREGLDHLRRGVQDVDKALVDAHFKLLSRVFVDEGRAVHCPTLNLGRERHGSNDDQRRSVRPCP